MNIITGLWVYTRETSFREAWGLMVWRPLICLMRDHFWEYHEHHEDLEPPLLTERWRTCRRCERYEDLM